MKRFLILLLSCLLGLLTFASIANAAVLVGDQTLETSADLNPSGVIQAFKYTAGTTGTTTDAEVYVASGNAATTLKVGVYSNNGSNKPGTLLASGSKTSPTSSAWNDVTLGSASLSSGTVYWIAILGTGGSLHYRDQGSGSPASWDTASGQTGMPSTYPSNNSWLAGNLSAYVNGSTGSAPVNTVLPSVSGTDTQGQTLTTTNGTWTGSPTSYSYQWRDCDSAGANCSDISGATSSTYVLVNADAGHTVRAVVTATNANGSTPATSAQTSVVMALAPVNTAVPTISGSTTQGSVLTEAHGTWTNNPTSYSYQWQRCTTSCSNISGATSQMYTLAAGDVGDTIDVIETATNSGGSTNATSSQTATITASTGFPDSTNTGYQNAPSCPFGITTTISGSWSPAANTTYSCTKFNGVGPLINVSGDTFYGDEFVDHNVSDAEVKVSTTGSVTFNYCTFGSDVSSPPVSYGNGNQYGINQTGNAQITVDHSDFWGYGEGMQVYFSSQTQPLSVSNSWFHDPSADGGGTYHTDGILSNNGPLPYAVINHNTVSAVGNTNALAFQSTVPGGTAYQNETISNNYFSGFNIMVDVGTQTTNSSHISFTGNTWGTDFEPQNTPLYSTAPFTVANNGTWSGNKIKVKSGTTWMASGNDGLYWWPTDSNPANNTQIIGHSSDYTEP